MKTKTGFTALMIATLWGWNAQALILHACETSASIVARADDDVCDLHVDAAEECFTLLNRRFSLFMSRPDKTPAQDLLTEAQPIQDSYVEAVKTVGDYLKSPVMRKDVCGDQIEKISVMAEEFQIDLNDVSKRISEIKARGAG